MVVVTPSGGQRVLPFSAVTHQRLHRSAARPGADPAAGAADQVPGAPFGQPLPGGRLAWAANGAALEVLCCRTGARRAAWTFGAHRGDAPPPQVTAVCAVSEAAGPAAAHLLAVGLDCGGRSEAAGGGGGGMVCVFDVSSAAVVRAVQLPHQVTALAVLRAPADSPDVCQSLQAMDVLAAVGTQAGFVLLLDLCLDGRLKTDERAPGAATYVTVLEPAAEQHRQQQAALGNHLCLPLNDTAVEAGLYRHYTASGRLEHAQPAADTWVSTVHWLPQLRSLVVGLSFGSFQIWSLETLQLEFASRYEPDQLPIVGCVFLEPENDPRCFVYLWLLNSVPAYHDMNGSVASAALYALLYSERQWEQGAPVYRGLEQAGMKLVYDLTTTPEQPDAGRVSASCLLSAFPLPAASADASGVGGDDSGLVPRDFTCCAIAWEAWTEDGASACTCLAVFDLNRWYQAHMPHRVDAAALERCQYLRFFSLDARDGIVMGVSVRAAEPRSGLLSATLLLDVGIQPVTFCGPQEQFLRALQAAGGAQLAHPLQAYEAARRLGLVAAGAISPAEQRETLLTLALERGFSSLLAACAANWSSGDADPAGCTLRALLDWLWWRAVEAVRLIDATCVPLFDMSGGALADDDVTALHGLRAQLEGMGHVLDTMATRTANTDVGLSELQSKRYVLRLRSLHTAVILWLCHAGLLPEQAEADGAETLEFAYPGAALAQWYTERRRQLGRRQLMIDGLVEELGEPLRASWQEEGDGLYPPRTLQALTRTYLLDGVPDVRKHRLTHYLLLDLSRLVSDEHFDTLKSFPSSFAMSPSLIKLTHAFWHLDHGNVDSALVFLMDPLVQPGDLTAWQHRRIVESLLAQEAPRAALQYARARHLPAPHAADLRLHLRVLLDNGLVTEALRYERRHRALGGDQLADWLLGGCQQRRLLTQLMRQPLDAVLERRFIEFLQDNVDKECAELLHVFYLQRGRYREAAGLQRRLAAAAAPPAPERADFRQSLHQLLPALTHQRDGWLRAGPGRQGAPGARRQPLSAQLHQVPATVRSRAILIQGLLEQEDREPTGPTVEATPFRPRHKRKMPDEDDDMGTPRSAQRRPLRPDVRRLLQTPPVRRAPRRSDLEVGTPEARTPAAVMTPQSILKVRRYLEASGAARGEDTPSKQLRFGLLRGRRSLEESRADVTPPPLATLFTPGKTPGPLRPPTRTPAAAAAAAERSPSPVTTTAPKRLASLFTPGKTPRPLATYVGRLAEPRVTLADVWAAAGRTPTPEPVSPPQKRQSLASELDDSEFYSFEASPTVANQTVEIFDRERKLRLVERSWHDESDAVVTMGGDVTRRSHTGDADDTVSSPALPEDGGQRHSTPQQEHSALRSPGAGRRLAPDLVDSAEKQLQQVMERSVATDSPDKQLHLVSPSPRRELHKPSGRSSSKQSPETPAGSRSRVTQPMVSDKLAVPLEEGGRRVSGSSGEFSPLIGNKFTSLSMEGGLDALEAQVLTKPMVHTVGSETGREKSPEQTGDDAPGEEPVILKRTAWVTGEEEEGSLSTLEDQVLTATSVVRPKPTVTKVRQQSPGGEPIAVKRTAWVTGKRQDGGEPDSSLASLESQILTDTSVLSSPREEPRRREYTAGKEQVVVKQVAWVIGDLDQEEAEPTASEEDTPPLSSSYLAPPAGMQAALERIDRALTIPEWSVSDAPSRPSLLSAGSSSEVADCRMELRLEPDTDGEEEEAEPTEGYTSLQAGPSEPVAPSSPGKPTASRLSRSSVLRPAADSPLLTPRRSLRRRSGVTPLIESIAVEGGSEAKEMEVSAVATTESSSQQVLELETAAEPEGNRSIITSPTKGDLTIASSPKKSPRVDAPSPRRSPRIDPPSPKKSTRVDTPSPKRSPHVDTPSPKRSTRVDTPSPKRSPRVDTPSPKRAPRVDTPSSKRAPRVDTPSPKRSPLVAVPSSKTPATVTVTELSSPESSSLAKDSPASGTQPSEHVSSVAEIMSPSTSSQEESTEPFSSPEVKITSSSMPVSKVTTPASSPPTRTSAPIRPARLDQTTLSPLTEEEPSEAPLSPAVDEAAPLPATPSSLRRRGRGSSAGPTTPRSRLSLLASVEPLSPVPEGQSVGAAAGDATEQTVIEEEEEVDVEEPVPEPTPASTRKRTRRGSSAEPEVPPMSIRKSQRSRAASVGPTTPATPVRRSARSRGASLEPETRSATTGVSPGRRSLRAASVEMDAPQAPATPSRTVRSRQTSEEPEEAPDTINSRTKRASQQLEKPPALESTSTSKRMRKTSETKSVDSAVSADASEKSKSTKKASKEPKSQSKAEITANASRDRKASEEPEEPSALDTTQRTRRTRKASEEPEEPSALDTTQRTRRTRKASEEPGEPSELDTTQRTRRTRKVSQEPEESSVLDKTQRTRRTRKASEEPEQSVLDTTQRTRQTRKASEEPEEPSALDTTQRTRRTRKASEEPGEPSVLDTPQRTRRTRKPSEEPEEPSVLDTTRKGRRGKKTEEPAEASLSESVLVRSARSRKTSDSSEADVFVPASTSKRTRKQSQASEGSEDAVTPERAAKRVQRLAASPARSTRARSLSVQPASPEQLPVRAASEQPPEDRPAALPPTKRARGSSSRKGKSRAAVSAAAGEDGAPDAAAESSPSPPLRRRVAGRSSQSTGTARRSQLTAIVESAAETMPPPAAGSRRRRRRTTRPAPAEGEEEETGSPVVLLTEEQLESLREREGASPEPMSRDRRTSIARTRQRTGGRRSVRLW